MIVQIIDGKAKCPSVFFDGKISEGLPSGPIETWDYSEIFDGRDDVLFAKIFANGRTVDQVCPEGLKDAFSRSRTRLEAFHRSLQVSHASANGLCLTNVIPEEIIVDYCSVKQEIIAHVVNTFQEPDNYDFLVGVLRLTNQISRQQLNLDEALKLKYHILSNRILYNPFGAKTGRLGLKKGSFPILNLKKAHRDVLRPQHDHFLSLDYNAAEIRVFLALLEPEHPMLKVRDIHDWNSKNLFDGLPRDEAKQKFFAWLYNPGLVIRSIEIHYPDKNELMQSYRNGRIRTMFGRTIECEDRFKAINNLVQSTLADLFLEQAMKIFSLLRGKRTSISFLLHDNLVLDVDKSEEVEQDVIRMFGETRLGNFPSSIKVGRNLLDMKDNSV